MHVRQMFQRTECGCEVCKVGCRTMPGSLIPGDLEAIAEHVGAEPDDAEWVAANFRASDGAKVAQMQDDGTIKVWQIPSIVPAQRPNGECVFYEGGRCSIHEVAPAGCSLCDTHMDRGESEQIVKHMLVEQCDGYQPGQLYGAACRMLQQHGLTAPPIQERRARYDAEERLVRRIHA